MSKWLSQEWFDETAAVAAKGPSLAAVSARIQVDVTGGPDGDVRYHRVLEDGRLTAGGPGPAEEPDVSLTLRWGDAASVLRGELDPNVAFMQGRMKVVGSMGVLFDLLPVTTGQAYQDLRGRIAAVTEF